MGSIVFALRKLWQNVRHDHQSLTFNVVVLTLSFFTVIVVGVVGQKSPDDPTVPPAT